MSGHPMSRSMRDELLKLASEEGGLKLAANRLMRALREGEVSPYDVADAYTIARNKPELEQILGGPDPQLGEFRVIMHLADKDPVIRAMRDESERLADIVSDARSAEPLHIRTEIEYLRRLAEERLKDLPPYPPADPKKVLGDVFSEYEEELPARNQPYTTTRQMRASLGLPDDPLKDKVFFKKYPGGLKQRIFYRILPEARRTEFLERRDRRLAEAANQAVAPIDLKRLPAASSPLPNINEETISRILRPVTTPLSAVTERPVIQAMENAATELPATKAIQYMGSTAGEGVGKKPMNPWLKRGLIGAGLATAGLGTYGLYRALSKNNEQGEEERQEAQPTVAPPPVTPLS